mgnify:CR=1 FL=1
MPQKEFCMKKKPKEVIAKGLSLPRDVVFGDFIITLTGNCEAYIENYRGIVSYNENKISIQGNHVVLNICGCDLEVDFLLTGINEDQRKDQKAGICMIFFERSMRNA